MYPEDRYDLRPGEWRKDPPRVGYGADRSGVVEYLTNELRAEPWTMGQTDDGPAMEVHGRKLATPPRAEDLAHLVGMATPAPYGRGEDTIVDPQVRDALQIGAEHVKLEGTAWERLESEMLAQVATKMGLEDATLHLVPLKLLIYSPGGHFAEHADTEKCPGMIASLALIVPGEHEGGALVIKQAPAMVECDADGTPHWRWAAWYADCRHQLEPVTSGTRVAMTFGVKIEAVGPLMGRQAGDHRISWALYAMTYTEDHTQWAARGVRARADNVQYGQKMVWGARSPLHRAGASREPAERPRSRARADPHRRSASTGHPPRVARDPRSRNGAHSKWEESQPGQGDTEVGGRR